MISIRILFLILVLSCISYAQTQYPVISWSEDIKCGLKVRIPETDTVNCDFVISDGRPIAILSHNGLTLAGFYAESGDYLVIDAYVKNGTGRRILVDPATWLVLHYKTEADYVAGKILQQADPIPPTKIAEKMLNRVRWANALASVGAAFQTQSSNASITATDNRGTIISGTATSSFPDYAAQARAREENARRSASTENKAQAVVNSGLYANTVFDNESVSGFVHFKANKKAKFTMIYAKIEGVLYVFEIRK